jgi:hypothetical protein
LWTTHSSAHWVRTPSSTSIASRIRRRSRSASRSDSGNRTVPSPPPSLGFPLPPRFARSSPEALPLAPPAPDMLLRPDAGALEPNLDLLTGWTPPFPFQSTKRLT